MAIRSVGTSAILLQLNIGVVYFEGPNNYINIDKVKKFISFILAFYFFILRKDKINE